MVEIVKFAVLMLLLAFCRAEADEVACERIEDHPINYEGITEPRTCFMSEVEIAWPGFRISSPHDETVKLFDLNNNRKIYFLPDKISERFPNLLQYQATYCSLAIILRINFQGLDKLTNAYFGGNQIEKISSDTFDDLTSLKKLGLGEKVQNNLVLITALQDNKQNISLHSDENKIKFLNGAIFKNLNNLMVVWLNGNECIKLDFEGRTHLVQMSQIVTQKCGFDETSLLEAGNATEAFVSEEDNEIVTLSNQW